ncbi:MAG: exodeoxyribonuclease VII large subunit [Bacteroidales bacterium]|nr:exodeoxyribonuclease VII large subunit [Bacteroidales bacterium]
MQESDGKKIYSLLEISTGLRKAVNDAFPEHYWITAEIAKLNFYPKSGHCYPDLVEKQQGKVKAQMRANIWSSHYVQINRKFVSVTGEPLKDGIRVLFLGRLTYHEQYGLSLNIVDMEPAFTLGEMAREKKVAIERLKKEGIFDANRQLPFPLIPKRVAVISVETSKGYSDFVNVVRQNSWNYRFELRLFPALLQGDGAVQSITEQLAAIEKQKNQFDVVIIIRGGGGDVGLSAYDNYQLARSVAVFPLPIVAGIGHSTNETIVQMVAFANKITPTEAGHFLIQQFHNFSVRLETAQEKLVRLSRQRLDGEKQRWKHQVKTFEITTMSRLQKANHQLDTIKSVLQLRPRFLVRNEQNTLMSQAKMIRTYAKQHLTVAQQKLELLDKQVGLMKPENVLKRGYSITYYKEKPVTNVQGIESGEKLRTLLYKGELEVKVEKIIKNPSHE